MKKLKGMEKNFSSLENKKLKDLKNIIGGITIEDTNDCWSQSSISDWNCPDTDFYCDGRHTQRQECLTDDCSATSLHIITY